MQAGNEAPSRGRVDEVPQGRSVIVVCKAVTVARRATSVLLEEGYEAEMLLGDMSGWTGYENGTFGYRRRSLVWTLTGRS